jgi:hypothetical protein
MQLGIGKFYSNKLPINAENCSVRCVTKINGDTVKYVNVFKDNPNVHIEASYDEVSNWAKHDVTFECSLLAIGMMMGQRS